MEESQKERIRKMHAVGEYIYRESDEYLFQIDPPKHKIRKNYPWEQAYIGDQIRITQEFFRCRGGSHNPPIVKKTDGKTNYVIDCEGAPQHSLPVRDGKEFIYPALIEILNYIQEKTKKKVVITCGHRCPKHNTYADPSSLGRTSKHMVGAEVDFYVKGLEDKPEAVVALINSYYQEHPEFANQSSFTEFSRWHQGSNVSIPPWYNKEIFVKLFKENEGRDFDNNHRFSYICIQLKWDRAKQERVSYSWSKAFNGYLRY